MLALWFWQKVPTMTLFVVSYCHPDEAGWRQHIMAHVGYLKQLLAQGVLRASGPMPGEADRRAMLIIAAPDRTALDAIVAADPFAIEGLIEDMTVAEWDPIFGAFNSDSSMAGQAIAQPA